MDGKVLFYILVIIIFAVGIIQTIYPEKTYMFGRRWMFKEDSELSDMGKMLIRIAGVIIIIISIVEFIKLIKISF